MQNYKIIPATWLHFGCAAASFHLKPTIVIKTFQNSMKSTNIGI